MFVGGCVVNGEFDVVKEYFCVLKVDVWEVERVFRMVFFVELVIVEMGKVL